MPIVGTPVSQGSPLIGMKLGEIREWFGEATGRYDLVSQADNSDTGANKYINAGVRLLDSMYSNPKRTMRYIKSLVQGDSSVAIPLCRSIKEVWIAATDGGKSQLTKCLLQDLRASYADDADNIDQGIPLYYALNIIGLGPTQVDSSASSFSDNNDVSDLHLPTRNYFEYNGLILMPPSDTDYTLNVYGDFSQVELEADDDQNFWSVMYPEILVISSKACLERAYYPAEYPKTINTVREMLASIEYDEIEEEISEIGEMEG